MLDERKRAEKAWLKKAPQNKIMKINSIISVSTCINIDKSQKQMLKQNRQDTEM